MRKIVLLLLVLALNVRAQVGAGHTIRFARRIHQTLKEKEDKDIDRFLRFSYRNHSELRENTYRKIPIYSIFPYKKLANKCNLVNQLYIYNDLKYDKSWGENVFILLNPYRLYLTEECICITKDTANHRFRMVSTEDYAATINEDDFSCILCAYKPEDERF